MKKKLLALALSSLALYGTAHAALVETSATTFTDTTTGYSWLKLGQFYGMNYDQIEAALPSGYTFATEAQALTLTNDAPAGDNFAADAAVMGATSGRSLIWGFYGDGTTWLWKFSYDTNWNSNAANSAGWTDYGYSVSPSQSFSDLGAFVVDTRATAVPEPGSAPMLMLGLAGLAATAISRRRTAR